MCIYIYIHIQGQVQDAGLIFLSAMASNIAGSCAKEAIIPTTLVVLSIYTALLGLMLIIIGIYMCMSIYIYIFKRIYIYMYIYMYMYVYIHI
jgi:hypothetical protein